MTARPRGSLGSLPVWVRPAIALIAILLAYRVTLMTLVESMRLDTPLAHLALVPVLTIGLALHVRRRPDGPDIHDRQLDWIIGLGLCGTAVSANVVLPGRLSTDFWLWRIDLLSLPVFVAGVVTLAFGSRALWKYRLPIAFLVLAWPVPYSALLDRYLGEFTQWTIGALERTLGVVPVASRVVGSDSLFQVNYQGTPIRMSVASACSGANGLVGFLLVATAFVFVVDGRRWRKVAWLAVGALLVWSLNLVRILVIFWSAERWGEDVAIDGFHPYTGLVVFNIGVLIMVAAMRLFGLRFHRDQRGHTPTATSLAPIRKASIRQPSAMSLTIVALLATSVGLFNADIRDYDRIAGTFGSARLASFATSKETPDGWQLTDAAQYDWSRRFFGDTSTWRRYSYAPVDQQRATLRSNVVIIADVIETSDRAALEAYGVEECYDFHNYKVGGQQSVDLGSGLVGSMLTWTEPKNDLTYTTLYWHWPIATPTGTRYERVTLLLQDAESNVFDSPPLASDLTTQVQLNINDLLRGSDDPIARERQVETRQFMIGFAREMVLRRQPAASDTTVD
jgi:exosortase/archaeosortase family protein